MAMASSLSVTVSIAAEINGMPSITSRVSRVRRSASAGSTLDAAGTSKTSSNASPSGMLMQLPAEEWRDMIHIVGSLPSRLPTPNPASSGARPEHARIVPANFPALGRIT